MFKGLKKILLKSLGTSLTGSGLWGWSTPGEWNKDALIKQYVRVVYPVVSAIAEDAAKVDLIVKRNDKPVASHELLKLLRRPNPDYSQFQFLELHFTYMKLVGESYWYMAKGERTGKTKELYLLRPSLMRVVAAQENNPAGLVTGYVMNLPNGKKIPFEKEEILHFKMPNPNNPYYGMSPVEAAKDYIQTEGYSTSWTKNSIYNSGRPSGIVNLKGTINPEQFKKIQRQFKEQYSGTKNAGKTLMLRGLDGIDYQKLGMELGDIALREMKDMSRDDIMMVFRISKTMLGISDDVNRANAQENHAVFTENIIIPELDRFIDHLNAFLMPRLGYENETVSYQDMDMRSDTDKLAEWTAGHNKWLTTNDIRIERGLDPLPGGDVIREPISNIPWGTAPDKPEKSYSVKKNATTKVDIFKELTVRSQDNWIVKYHEFLDQELELQKKEILEKNKKALLNQWSFDVEASQGRIEGVFNALGVELMQEAAKYALEVADDTDTIFEINQRVTEYLTERTNRFAIAMNDETIKQLDKTLTEGIREGESIRKLRKRVEEVYSDAIGYRSERIARTEALAVSNEGANEAYRQSPLVNAKEWSANYGACEFCLALDGKVVGLDEDYYKIGQSVDGNDGGSLPIGYENIQHPPVHPNCRCALLPVIR